MKLAHTTQHTPHSNVERGGFLYLMVEKRKAFFHQLRSMFYVPRANKGFSLIELLISMALFIVVLTIAVGALLVLINANLKAQNMNDAVSNVQFALDSMSREIRTGMSYYCSTSVPASPRGGISDVADCNTGTGGTFLSIIEGGQSLTNEDSLDDRRIEYRYNSADRTIERRIGNSSWVSITSSGVSIDVLRFNVNGSAPKSSVNNVQPNVSIFIQGTVTDIADTSSTFQLQTTVTQRILDL